MTVPKKLFSVRAGLTSHFIFSPGRVPDYNSKLTLASAMLNVQNLQIS